MRRHVHPSPPVLLRFLRGEAPLAERRAVVRHLLAGCLRCAAAIQPGWGAEADRKPRREMEG